MSFLDKFRKPAENEETLVNNQKIKDGETTLDVSDDTKPEEPAKDVTNDSDNDEDKLAEIDTLVEIRDIVENDKSLEGSNPLVTFCLKQCGIELEQSALESNAALLDVLNAKINK